MGNRHWVVLALLITGVANLGPSCVGQPNLIIQSPTDNHYHDLGPTASANLLLVTGQVVAGNVGTIADIEAHAYLNQELADAYAGGAGAMSGVPVVIDPVTGAFSVEIDIDARTASTGAHEAINTIYIEAFYGAPTLSPRPFRRKAVTVVSGWQAGVWSVFADPGVELRVNEQGGFDALVDTLAANLLANVDIPAQVAPNGFPEQILDQEDVLPSVPGFPLLDGYVTGLTHGPLTVALDAHGAASPTPSVTEVIVEIPSFRIDFVVWDIEPDPSQGIFGTVYCEGYMQGNPLILRSYLDQTPAGANVAVSQTQVVADLQSFNLVITTPDTICANTGLAPALANVVSPQFQADAEAQFVDALDGDAANRPLIEEAVEVALADLQIGQGVGQSLGADLNAEFTSITEDDDGILYLVRTAPVVTAPTACDLDLTLPPYFCPDPGPASYNTPFSLPGIPAAITTTPGGLPFGLGLGMTEPFFGQILRVLTAQGALGGYIEELDQCATPQNGNDPTLTADCLFAGNPTALFITGLAPTDPVRLAYYATTPPVVTGLPFPSGSMAQLAIRGLGFELQQPVPGGLPTTLTSLRISVDAGINMSYDPVADAIDFDLVYCPPADCGVPAGAATALFTNFPNANPVLPVTTSLVEALLNGVSGGPGFLESDILPVLADSLQSFGLPTLAGITLDHLESARAGDSLSLFFDLTP